MFVLIDFVITRFYIKIITQIAISFLPKHPPPTLWWPPPRLSGPQAAPRESCGADLFVSVRVIFVCFLFCILFFVCVLHFICASCSCFCSVCLFLCLYADLPDSATVLSSNWCCVSILCVCFAIRKTMRTRAQMCERAQLLFES